MNKAVFIDKDGTLIKDVPYNVDPGLIELYDGATEGLHALQSYGFKLIVVSNQSGVAHGYFPETALLEVEAKLQNELNRQGVSLDAFYFCPHHPDGTHPGFGKECECRKPKPGMLLKASEQHNIDLNRSWMIGDILNDIEAGNSAGCRTVLINNGNETEWKLNPSRVPDHLAANIQEAIHFILNQENEKRKTND